MSQQQQIEHARHGHPLPRARSSSTYWMRGTAVVLALCVVGLPLNVALGTDSTMNALLVPLLIISLVCVVIAAAAHRAAKKAIPHILTDERTVHWTYTPPEWQRFCTESWRRSIRYALQVTAIAWGAIVMIVLVSLTQASGVVDVAAALALGTGVALVLGLLLLARAALLLRWRQRQTTPDVYLHPRGFILCGWYSALNWNVGGRRKITFKAGDPGVLFFDVGTGRGARVLEVPVPQGHEDQAQYLALSLRFPNA